MTETRATCSEKRLEDDCTGASNDGVPSRTKRELISAISHEIRTPINGIMGMTKIAMENADKPERVTECLRKIGNSSQYLLSLVNNVLDMSKIEAGRVTINNEPFNITAMAERCCSIIQGQLIDKDLQLICSCKNIRHNALVGDSLRLSQIIINILGNSVKFTQKGEIRFNITELAGTEEKAVFCFEFKDTGKGMSEEFIPRLFEPFSQEGASGAGMTGTGLGMAIVKQYVDMMHGKIHVDSKRNKGTEFVIELEFEIDRNPTEDKTEVHGNIRLDGEKILLAEDNELNAEITVEILQETGAEVVVADNGAKAVELYSQSEESGFDLILMDVRMPDTDGITAARKIRGLNRADAREVPIIAITADIFEEDRSAALEAGMNAYLTKPIDADALMHLLENVL
jgi:CheY-like chemotaxis protein